MRRAIAMICLTVAVCLTIALGLTLTAARPPASPAAEFTAGRVPLMSAGPLAFGPSGVLFVGDSVGGSIVAIDTQDNKAPASAVKINVDGVDAKVAAMVGIPADQIVINNVAVNPVSKNVYLSASRAAAVRMQCRSFYAWMLRAKSRRCLSTMRNMHRSA